MNTKKKISILIIVVILAALSATIVLAQDPDIPPEIYYACVNNTSGTIKMVGVGETCSNSNDMLIYWNQEGVQGEHGQKGDPGPPGDLALAGQSCGVGEFVTGVASDGNIICSSIGERCSGLFPGADLSGCDLSDERLWDLDLTDANLAGANLTGADLDGTNLTNADLSFATLTGADLSLANLAGAIWSDTACPDGTNSDDHGSSCEGHL